MVAAEPRNRSNGHVLKKDVQAPPADAPAAAPGNGADAGEHWYLTTSLPRPGAATAWYAQRPWLEATFKDAKAGWRREVQAHGTVSLITFALEFLARFQRVPAPALPRLV